MKYYILIFAMLVGCSRANAPVPVPVVVAKPAVEHSCGDGWWCNEHGVPESICGICNYRLEPEFKAKGDWCAVHERPESQCFICHPELKAEFIALYVAKYGHTPDSK